MTFSCLERATESWLIICNLLGWGGVLAASATSCVWGEWSEDSLGIGFCFETRSPVLHSTSQSRWPKLLGIFVSISCGRIEITGVCSRTYFKFRDSKPRSSYLPGKKFSHRTIFPALNSFSEMLNIM